MDVLDRMIIDLVVEGHTNREISHRLSISYQTVGIRLRDIYRLRGIASVPAGGSRRALVEQVREERKG